MSELTEKNFITYEYPMNEKIRSWLRLETLLLQVYELSSITSYTSGIAFFRAVSELIEVLDRGEVRSDLMKELEKHRHRLSTWADSPNADNELISVLREELRSIVEELMAAEKFGSLLRSDKIISMVRQRLSIPGGCCGFDLPTLQLWLNIPQSQRDITIQSWLKSIEPLKKALHTVLTLMRQSGIFEIKGSHNGFYQGSVDGKELLRIKLSAEYFFYPQISGHKAHFAIRFLHIDSVNGILPDIINFELSCC